MLANIFILDCNSRHVVMMMILKIVPMMMDMDMEMEMEIVPGIGNDHDSRD